MSLNYKSKFKNLDFLISIGGTVGKILKIITFMDKIDNAIVMAKYLYLRFLKNIKKKSRSNYIIRIFITNFMIKSRIRLLINFKLGETQI